MNSMVLAAGFLLIGMAIGSFVVLGPTPHAADSWVLSAGAFFFGIGLLTGYLLGVEEEG